MKKTVLMLGMALCLPVVSSCSSDDDDDGGDDFNAEGTEISIPASVTDGVRVQKITADDSDMAVNVEYNEDGTISSATTGGQEFVFEYGSTRGATPTGRKLVMIKAKNLYDPYDDDEEWTAYNFTFNTDGFIVGYTENIKDKGEGYSDDTTLKATLAYNAHGRIESLNLSWRTKGWDEDEGNYSENGSTKMNYKYTNGGALKESGFTDSDSETVKMIYEYDTDAHNNTYNVVTPQLGKGMAIYSPILYVLAVTGYVGNASSQLPTRYTYDSYSDYTDGDENYHDTYTMNLEYRFWDDNRIRTVTESRDNYEYPITSIYTYSYLTE